MEEKIVSYKIHISYITPTKFELTQENQVNDFTKREDLVFSAYKKLKPLGIDKVLIFYSSITMIVDSKKTEENSGDRERYVFNINDDDSFDKIYNLKLEGNLEAGKEVKINIKIPETVFSCPKIKSEAEDLCNDIIKIYELNTDVEFRLTEDSFFSNIYAYKLCFDYLNKFKKKQEERKGKTKNKQIQSLINRVSTVLNDFEIKTNYLKDNINNKVPNNNEKNIKEKIIKKIENKYINHDETMEGIAGNYA